MTGMRTDLKNGQKMGKKWGPNSGYTALANKQCLEKWSFLKAKMTLTFKSALTQFH